MKILVCNIGSSSLKFQLLEMPDENVIVKGGIERVGSDRAVLSILASHQEEYRESLSVSDHKQAVDVLLKAITGSRALPSPKDLAGIGFKCVQAGEKNGTVFLTEDILEAMEFYRDLAPAHNPAYLDAIRMFREALPGIPLVGVFEPGFHAEIPLHAKVYGVPWDWYETYGARKYGYHGASHRYVTGEAIRILGFPADRHRIISCHLGGSSSLCAFKNGRSIDTSMGFTPQSGLLQGRRIGDLDPFVLPYIMKRKGISLEAALEECSTNAGLAGLSGTSGDMRDILEKSQSGDARARLARAKYIYDIKRYVGGYIVLMGGLDAVVFTGGIGEKDSLLRQEVLQSLSFLGLQLDLDANKRSGELISMAESPIAALVLPTNEELVVARETTSLILSQSA